MEELIQLKEKLIVFCEQEIVKKRSILEEIMNDAQQSANSETKSTAGDKHDTARAMAHLEQEKNAQQLKVITDQERALSELKKVSSPDKITFGSLVKTSTGIFFISIGLGKVEIGGQAVFLVSPISPIANNLKDKTALDSIQMNGNAIKILMFV